VLLFRFVIKRGPTAGGDYWATVGGEVEAGETFAEAARRELLEETGLTVEEVGEPVGEQEYEWQLVTGEWVVSQERFFIVKVVRQTLSSARWTALEKEVMAEHRWWSVPELRATRDMIYPENLVEMLGQAGG